MEAALEPLRFEDDQGTDASSNIEVRDLGHDVPPDIEQAAMLYCIEQPEAACAVIESAIQGNELGKYVRRAWGMLFELYQVLNRRQDFEQLGVAYAAKFETSPPTWVDVDQPARPAGPKKPMGKGLGLVRITGVLNAGVAEILEKAMKAAEKQSSLRIEFTKLTDADDQGCATLLAALDALRWAGKEYSFSGTQQLVTLLSGKVSAGVPENESIWKLLLELHQRSYNQDAFDDTAVNYAITFEVSPPAYEPPKRQAGALPPVEPSEEIAEEPEEDDDMACVLEGEIVAATDVAFAPIRKRAEQMNEVVVDTSRLKRMDFVAATNLMNLATLLAAQSKRLRLVKASYLVSALWDVIGLGAVAVIETRKI